MKIISCKALLAATLLLGVGAAQAATCTAFANFTDPDATLTNSTACGHGTLNNDDAAEVNIAENVLNLNWTQLDKDDQSGDEAAGALRSTPVAGGGGTDGSWAIDANPAYDTYLIVLKDGATTSGNTTPDTTQWFWFIVDTTAGCSLGSFSGVAGLEYCGNWTMYGVNGNLKNISHITLYAANDTVDPPREIPEPGSLALVGLALLGLVATRRFSA